MQQAEQTFPNYVRQDESPDQEGPGVALRLVPANGGQTYRKGAPIVACGKYCVDAALNERAEGAPLTHLLLRVGKEGEDEGVARAAQAAHAMVPPSQRGPLPQGEYYSSGYFNFDLDRTFGPVLQPGGHWVVAELFDMKSQKLTFEVK
jgi:hypothetical protein